MEQHREESECYNRVSLSNAITNQLCYLRKYRFRESCKQYKTVCSATHNLFYDTIPYCLKYPAVVGNLHSAVTA